MKILIAGDFFPQATVKRLLQNKEYAQVLGEVAPIINSVDYAIVNYESPVTLGRYSKITKCGSCLCSDKNGVEAIKWAGFDMVTLANNHIFDYGCKGLEDTLATCREYKIDTVGVGKNLEEASKVFYKEVDGKVLAIINCCEHEFSVAGVDSPGANPLNPIGQYYKIQEARENADKVLVIIHGGHEHFQLPSPRMVETYRFFIDAGADAVVNHHQHCYSGYEIYNGKPIFYGLGNFCFSGENKKVKPIWFEGFMLQLDFKQNDTEFALYPYVQCRDNVNVRLMSGKETERFNSRVSELNEIIADNRQLRSKHKEWMDNTEKDIELRFTPYDNKYLKYACSKGLLPKFLSDAKKVSVLNYIRCEAHRDRTLNMLEKYR